MLILQRMAMATSSSFLSIPLLKTSSLLSPVKHCASPLSSEFRALSLYGGRNGVSTSSAMATEAQVSTQDDKLKDAQMEAADKPEKVVLPTNESSESLIKIRDTCAHVMAMAVQKLFPDAKVTIGPWIENGFYYDFDMEPLTDKELKRIKKEMILGIALNLFLLFTQIYQLAIPLFVIMRILALNIFIVEFSQNDAGGGLVFWHPKGAIVRHVMEDLWKKIHIECGYDLLYTPHVAKANLWQISGHLDYDKENMYDQMNVEDELYQLSTDELPLSYLGLQKEASLIS